LLGYPDQALTHAQEALVLAEELKHALTRSMAMLVAGCMVHQLRRERAAARRFAEGLIRFSTEHRLPVYHAAGTVFLGWVQGKAGQGEGGAAHIRRALAEVRALGIGMNLTHFRGLLAEVNGIAGQAEGGLSAVAEALALVDETEERYYEAELCRLRGELLLQQGDEAEAEGTFHKAIEVARRQRAKSWELRAAMSLCRLWREQGKVEKAQQRLTEIYGWFTEGFDTPDLREASALLEDLSSQSSQGAAEKP
jgi:predicted ATPase